MHCHISSFFLIILRWFGELLILKLPIILFHPVLLPLPLFTSSMSTLIYFSQTHSVSTAHSIWGTNLTLLQKAVTYYLNTYYRCTVGPRRILVTLDKVVFGWAVRAVVVQLSPGLMWTTNILFSMYLISVTVCAAIYRLDWRDQTIYTLQVIWVFLNARFDISSPLSSVSHYVL